MIDWITAYVPIESFVESEREILRLQTDRVVRFCPKTGDVRYETSAWDSVRSDSHQVVSRVTGSALWIQGSPARCIGDGDTVFSSGASKAEDIISCMERMTAFLFSTDEYRPVTRPDINQWVVTHVDVTRNLLLDSLAEVRQFLAFMRGAESGRLRVNNPDGDTVYWNKNSRYKKGKAYAKGPHLRYLLAKKTYSGRRYEEPELLLAERLARLELSLFRRQWEKNLNIKRWQDLTPDVLAQEWENYFGQFIGQTIMNDEELRRRIKNVYIKRKGEMVQVSPGQAKVAYTCWYLIKSMGWEMARESMSQTAWYRNLQILKLAGLKVTDLGNGKIIPFRVQKVISGYQVSSWAELRKAA
jgi:II/X family phage/plasmid replication protein